MKLIDKIKKMKLYSKVIVTLECVIAAGIIGYSLFTNSFSIFTLFHAILPIFVGSSILVGIEYNVEGNKRRNEQICLGDIPEEMKCNAPSCDKSNVKQDVYVVPYDKIGYFDTSIQNMNAVKVRKRTRNDFN